MLKADVIAIRTLEIQMFHPIVSEDWRLRGDATLLQVVKRDVYVLAVEEERGTSMCRDAHRLWSRADP